MSNRQISMRKNNNISPLTTLERMRSSLSRTATNLMRLATIGVGVQQVMAFSLASPPLRPIYSSTTSGSVSFAGVPYSSGVPFASYYLASACKPLCMSENTNNEDMDDTTASLVMEEGDDEEYQEIVDEGARLDPKPPSYPPPMVDVQLENDLLESERRVQLYEMEMEMMREQLVLKNQQLLEEQNSFRDVKSSLMDKIVEFTQALAQRDEEIASKSAMTSNSKETEEELRKEVQSLVAQLRAKTSAYENEIQTTQELKKRYEEANDALEFEQMAFQKEKASLQEAIEWEKKNIKALENKLQEAQSSFDKISDDLTKKLKSETEKLATTEGAWKLTKEALQIAQDKLKDTINEKEESLSENKRELNSLKTSFDAEREVLKKQIQDEQNAIHNVREELKQEQEAFEKLKKDLEAATAEERSTVKKLQEDLVREQIKFNNDRENLENRIQEQSGRLSLVEKELAKEQDNYSKMKEELEFKWAEEIRVGKLKKRQMNERYTEIRREMTELWESAKRQARKEQDQLSKKYEKKIANVQKEISRLEVDLSESKDSGKDLRLLLAQAEAKQKLLLADSEAIEAKYRGSLEEISGLQKVLKEKKNIIAEQEKQLGIYDTSLRAVARLSLKVTGNKIKGAGSRMKKAGGSLKRLLQNNPPEDNDL